MCVISAFQIGLKFSWILSSEQILKVIKILKMVKVITKSGVSMISHPLLNLFFPKKTGTNPNSNNFIFSLQLHRLAI